MHLTHEDFRSGTWKRFSRLLQERLQELRELNDSQSFGTEKTSSIRGSIAEVKRILALADEASASQAVVPSELTGDDTPV
jgi:hypothetical protein